MALAQQGAVGGASYLQMWFTGGTGRANGQVKDSQVVAPITSSPLLIDHIISFTPSDFKRVIAALRGGNKSRGNIQFGLADPGEQTATFQDIDSKMAGIAENMLLDASVNTRRRFMMPQHEQVVLPQFGLMFSTTIQPSDEGSDGGQQWVHYVYPRCQGAVTFPQMNFQTPGEAKLTFTLTKASRYPTGQTLASMFPALTGGKLFYYAFITENFVTYATHFAKAATNTFTLPFLPLSSAVDQTYNYSAKNGTATAATSVNTSTGAVGITGADNDVWVMEYETALTPSA